MPKVKYSLEETLAAVDGGGESAMTDKHPRYKKLKKKFKKNLLAMDYEKDLKKKKKKLKEGVVSITMELLNKGEKEGYSKDLFEKFINNIIRNKFNLSSRIISSRALNRAIREWDNFNKKEAWEILKKNKKEFTEKMFLELMYRFSHTDYIKQVTKDIRNTSIKLPKKKLSLKESTKNLSDMSVREIYTAGIYWKHFDFKKGLDELIEKDKNGKFIYHAGIYWKHFDFKKGLDELIEKDEIGEWTYKAGKYWKTFDYKKGLDGLIKKDENGEYIYYAGKYWKTFDFKKGLDGLIEKHKTGEYIYRAGKDWKEFGYKKALEVLKNTKYYKDTLKNWPKGIEDVKKITKEIRITATKLSKKKFSLKEAIQDLSSMTVREIQHAGVEWKEFDFKKGFEELVKKDKDGNYICAAGVEWKEFDFKKGFEELIKKDKTGQFVYYAGVEWKDFDFKKGMEELIKKDKDGYYIYYAGLNWKEFDYKKGFEELIKKDKDGNYIYWAGLEWKQFDYKKGSEALKNTECYKKSLKNWPKGIKGVEKITKKIRDTSIKLPKKKFSLKESFESNKIKKFKAEFNSLTPFGPPNDNQIKTIANLYKKIEVYVKRLNVLMPPYKEEIQTNIEDAYELLSEIIKFLREMSDWKKFDKFNAIRILKNILGDVITKEITDDWKIGTYSSKKEIEHLRKTSTKLPKKKFSLKEVTRDLSNMTKIDIYYAGIDWKEFDYKKGFEELIKKDKTGEYILYAGAEWRQFDFKKGLEALIKKDKTGNYIYWAGKIWKEFDYKKGFNSIKNTEYYKDALKDWPKGIKDVENITKEIRDKSIKLPKKKFSLKEAIQDLSSMTVREIQHAGVEWKEFDFKKGFEELIKKDKDGQFVYYAGKNWKDFDFKKGLDALIKKDKDGYYVYYAGKIWKEFDYKKGLDALIKKDKDGNYIYWAGKIWKQFDYEKGFNSIKNTEYYKDALKDWPKGIKDVENITKEIRDTSIKLPKKKLKLEDVLSEGAQDRGIFKAIFLAGTPGSGKSFISNKILSGTAGWKVVNPDILFELWVKKKGLKYSGSGGRDEEQEKLFLKARKKIDKLEELYLKGKLPIIIDRTGGDYNKTIEQKNKLEKMGYDTSMLFISTELNIALERNSQRERKVSPAYIKNTYAKIIENIKKYKEDFGSSFWVVDNSSHLTKEKEAMDIKKIREEIFKWISKKPSKPEAISWIAKEKNKIIQRQKPPKKKLSLKEAVEDLSSMTANNIYNAGLDWKEFDFKKGLDELIKKDKDKDGKFIYLAGKDWKQFDYKKGLEELIKKDEDGNYIYYAGRHWKEFNFKKGFDELVKKDKDGGYIFYAGEDWKQFDYKKGLDELVKKDKTGQYIYYAGEGWKEFDFKKGLEILKNTAYYKEALKNWPKGIEDIKKITKEIRKTSTKLPKKKFSL